jgi:hypothetical protein
MSFPTDFVGRTMKNIHNKKALALAHLLG